MFQYFQDVAIFITSATDPNFKAQFILQMDAVLVLFSAQLIVS